MFGSARAAHSLMEHKLIDEYWLFVNPILLGKGIPVFSDIKEKVNLELIETISLKCGVIALHYRVAAR
jgi:dihydrofolate reductase